MTLPPPLSSFTRWVLELPADEVAAQALARALALPAPLARLLVQRGHASEERARAFLRPSLDELADPFRLKGMAEAVEVIGSAVRSGVTILVHGDYDVDGQSATALLTRALRAAGASVVPFVPHRLKDGYDFGPAGLAEAERVGAGLILTCDCGITAVETVRQAREAGRRVVVTDHHLPGAVLPAADAVIDPQQAGDTSGLGMLCGTGLAFKLVQALTPALGLPETFALHLLDLVALATIADVVPLVGENRILVRHGLRVLSQTRWTGLRALIQEAGLAGRPIRAGQVAFILGPRINAAGRVGDASEGLRLLLTDDPEEAAALAQLLERQNAERQDLDQRILREAIELVEREFDLERDAAFVLASEGWHPGVVGIVASRVVERFGRPTFLIGLEDGIGKGSGRSISRFDLHAALVECADLLDRFGGHRMAAGLTVRHDRVEAFRARFLEVARTRLDPADLGPEQRVDLQVELGELTDDLERLLRHLEPCGMGNPAPVLGVRGAELQQARVVGAGHLKGLLRQGGATLEAIGFQLADRVPWLGQGPVDAAIRLERNEYMGRSSLQARLVALTPGAEGRHP
ncbi:MAG TPA: single-stranded-DNA-specific exonuclease RecJ [Gemmatimonadales bacterium]|nr:single-stranded-DNA-specific exonuclease RecJ [Gemmatimonadales bacterium]